jgi:transposase
LVIVWDEVSYHRSKSVQEFWGQTNSGLSAQAWKITCIRLALNAPEQNPVEDVWLLSIPHPSKASKYVKFYE